MGAHGGLDFLMLSFSLWSPELVILLKNNASFLLYIELDRVDKRCKGTVALLIKVEDISSFVHFVSIIFLQVGVV